MAGKPLRAILTHCFLVNLGPGREPRILSPGEIVTGDLARRAIAEKRADLLLEAVDVTARETRPWKGRRILEARG